jgi:Flp pilus assembly protein TadB
VTYNLKRSNTKLVAIFWLAQLVILGVLQYLYHPSILLAVIGLALLLGLVVLGTWSARRSASGARGIVLALVVASVSGFMFSQAMDVAYALLSAPEGLRFTVVFESLFAGLWILISSLAFRAWFARPEVEKQSDSRQS